MSVLTKKQDKQYGPRAIKYYGADSTMVVTIRYDDSCGNRHNTFSITAGISMKGRLEACGCLHDEIRQHFPELAHLIKWHLVSTDGPLHYIANTLYHLEKGNLEYARSSAVYGALCLDTLVNVENMDEQFLLNRLPELLKEFQRIVEQLGFAY